MTGRRVGLGWLAVAGVVMAVAVAGAGVALAIMVAGVQPLLWGG